nr:hypothetical protein Iba_chr05eCG17030 [Ipomoea batatas]
MLIISTPERRRRRCRRHIHHRNSARSPSSTARSGEAGKPAARQAIIIEVLLPEYPPDSKIGSNCTHVSGCRYPNNVSPFPCSYFCYWTFCSDPAEMDQTRPSASEFTLHTLKLQR